MSRFFVSLFSHHCISPPFSPSLAQPPTNHTIQNLFAFIHTLNTHSNTLSQWSASIHRVGTQRIAYSRSCALRCTPPAHGGRGHLHPAPSCILRRRVLYVCVSPKMCSYLSRASFHCIGLFLECELLPQIMYLCVREEIFFCRLAMASLLLIYVRTRLYACTCTFTHTHTHTHRFTHRYTHTHTITHTYTQLYTQKYTQTHTHTHTHTHTKTHTHTSKRTQKCAYTNTRTSKRTYM